MFWLLSSDQHRRVEQIITLSGLERLDFIRWDECKPSAEGFRLLPRTPAIIRHPALPYSGLQQDGFEVFTQG